MKFVRSLLAVGILSGACGGHAPVSPAAPTGPDFFESAGARLHFLLDLPPGPGPFPGVVIGHGSGPVTTADGAAYVPFLRARGFAVLRYDKRGVGQSTGTYRGVSAVNSIAQIGELGSDMAAAVAFLATRPQIDSRRLGLMGTSQAGWVMVAAAERSPLVRFAVAVTGSVEPVGKNIAYENLADRPIEEAYALLTEFDGTRGYDPGPVLSTLGAPTLWLLGAQDRLVPTRDCVRILGDLRAHGARTEFEVFAGEGHGLLGADFWPVVDGFLRRSGFS